MLRRLVLVLTCLTPCGLQAQLLNPDRLVSGSKLSSSHDPRTTISLPQDTLYLGADRWTLFGVADCEVHVFAQADARRVVQRLYWVQFEGFLPDKPDLTHTYRDQVMPLWGTEFLIREDFGPTDTSPKASSDLEHVNKLVRIAGYKMPAAILNVRMVHLLDQQKRRELMIIYMEDASLSGIEAWKDLLPEGVKAKDWPSIREALLIRATTDVVVTLK